MSNDPLRSEVIALFASRFGVPPETFDEIRLEEHRDEIWASTLFPRPNVASQRPAGLRALRRTPKGLKPTSAFLIHLGSRIEQSRIELELAPLEALLLGRRLDSDASDGFVALCFRGEVVGCGWARGGSLQAMIPTGRRRELLEALADEHPPKTRNL